MPKNFYVDMGSKKKSRMRSFAVSGMLLLTLLLVACSSSAGGTSAGATTGASSTGTPSKAGTTAPSSANSATSVPSSNVPAHQLQFTALRMVNTSIGWGLTSSAVYKTTDGGRNWYNTSPHSTQLKNPTGEFLNVSNAWIVSTVPNSANPNAIQVIRTVDGGQNWQSSSNAIVGNSTEDYAGVPKFINLQDGWLEVVTNGGPGAGSESVAIFRTADAGRSWAKVTDTTQQSSGLPNGGLKSGISFKDTHNGWATGRDASNTPWLYVTHNGGQNWQRQSLLTSTTNDFYLTTPPIFFGNLGIMPVSVSMQNGTATALYTTSDGGQTWTAPQSLAPFSLDSTDSIYVADQTHGWAINRDKQLYVTNSIHLQTWQPLPDTAKYAITQMSFVDALNGWAIGGANSAKALLHTIDGGRTWSSL